MRRAAAIVALLANLTVAAPGFFDNTVPAKKFVSPMKSATNRVAGRS